MQQPEEELPGTAEAVPEELPENVETDPAASTDGESAVAPVAEETAPTAEPKAPETAEPEPGPNTTERDPLPDAVEREPIPEATEQEESDSESPVAEDETLVAEAIVEPIPGEDPDDLLKAIIEAAIYITDEPLTPEQIAGALEQPTDKIKELLRRMVEEYARPDRGLTVRELAGGYKMGTKPEHHDHIRLFVKKLQPPLKLSLPALETLAVIAYKQPITAPEIMEIRGVQGAGVLKTLLDRHLIATAGRKDVVGKPIMYKTTKEFLIQFGLSSLKELPTLKEFEELGRLALTDENPMEASGSPFATPAQPERVEESGEEALVAEQSDTPLEPEALIEQESSSAEEHSNDERVEELAPEGESRG
jgi:segregation and condensation protein B